MLNITINGRHFSLTAQGLSRLNGLLADETMVTPLKDKWDRKLDKTVYEADPTGPRAIQAVTTTEWV